MSVTYLKHLLGLNFSAKVHSLLGKRVSPLPAASSRFWLLATFPRSRFKLTLDNVGLLLQSVLGGSAPLFVVTELEDWIFKFCVSSKEVGLLIYQMGFFLCEDFKVVFNLWNSRGFHFAKLALAKAQGVHHPWSIVASKKSRLSSQHSAHSGQYPLTGANSVPIGQSIQATSSSLDRGAPSSSPPESLMAYKFVDPAPFLPRGCQRQLVGFRKPMSRVILGSPWLNNNDVAIVSIEPLLAQQISFQSIRELLDDFLRNRKRVGVHSIQPCPFGQAYVRFHHVYDKDFLIGGGPHNYGQYRITFSKHDRGWNNRNITMNCKVWVMLLGFSIDYWTKTDVEKPVSEFGKLIVWEEDPNYLAHVVAKIRVVDLSEISWILVCSEGEGFEGNSWTVQCEILQYRLLGAGPADEDQPPNANDVDPMLFDFFGYGQPTNAGNGDGNQMNNLNVAEGPAPHWGLWPNEPADQDNASFIGPQVGQNIQLTFDLNINVEEDLWGIEQLVQAAEDFEHQVNDEDVQVIDATDSSDSSMENAPAHHLDPGPVQDVINENEFLGDIPIQDVQPVEGGGVYAQGFQQVEEDNNMQLGFVEFLMNNMHQPSAEVFRQWAKFFSPGLAAQQVEILLPSTAFFTNQLLNPLNFMWAKNFLSSPAMQFIQTGSHLQFSLPEKCPLPTTPICSAFQGPWSKSLLEQAAQIKKPSKAVNQGFKAMGCKDKNCIGCSVEPPSLSHSMIRNLGEAFCKIDPANLTFVALNKKKSVAPPGGKKLLKKKNTNSTDDSATPKVVKKKPKKQ
uniref:DUF7597 domain-containing protein n=1 Tax=Setaria viridis TaxID=4556 RepID=A0A4U6U6H1_SETVI|nr:hypothetical protein SEVIR_6G061100v2 [Setaria viridis]